ncbi:MAG: protein kinase [Bryobacteraceae bacterium]|nr:protein kinase [Bryobacteraceae bacterium]
MASDDWDRAKELFDQAIQQPISKRREFLNHVCKSREELESLMGLLAQHETIGFLDQTGPAWFENLEEKPVFRSGDLLCERFAVVRFVARGGMGEVYEAYDHKLRETVALKTIRGDIRADSSFLDQFAAEVSRARKVASRHVCRVHDLFSEGPTAFLTMEMLSGETLAERISRRRMPHEECLRIAIQLCDGLGHAHQEGIVHLDFKPANIILLEKEEATRAVITDFGVAHQMRRAVAPDATGGIVSRRGGTPAYMAPEQLQGGAVSPRTDVYALGVVLYEMAAGRRLFEDGSPRRADNQIDVERLPPEFRGRWLATVRKCLSVNPEERFSDASEVAAALMPGGMERRRWWVAGLILLVSLALGILFFPWNFVQRKSSASPVRSLVVVPFETVGEGLDQHIGDGIAEELIHALTATGQLQVIARESSFRLARQGLDGEALAKRFAVDAFIGGSFRRDGNRIRIIVRMVSSDGVQIWSQAFERREDQLAEAQRDVAGFVAGRLSLRLAGVAAASRPVDPKAYEYALLGRLHFNKRTEESVQKAREYLEKAVALDAGRPDMHFTLATIYVVLAELNLAPPADVLLKAKLSVEKGMAGDPESAEGMAISGYIAALYERRFDRALELLEAALARDPNLVIGHQWYAYTLAKLRRFDGALQHARRAVELDPVSIPAHNSLTVALWYSGDQAATLQQCKRLLEQEPDHSFAHLLTALILARTGRLDEAWKEYHRSSLQVLRSAVGIRTRGELAAIGGNAAEALKAAEELKQAHEVHRSPASYIAIVYAAANDREAAFQWLYRAYDEYDGFLSLMNVYPALAPLRADSRFTTLLMKLGMQ